MNTGEAAFSSAKLSKRQPKVHIDAGYEAIFDALNTI